MQQGPLDPNRSFVWRALMSTIPKTAVLMVMLLSACSMNGSGSASNEDLAQIQIETAKLARHAVLAASGDVAAFEALDRSDRRIGQLIANLGQNDGAQAQPWQASKQWDQLHAAVARLSAAKDVFQRDVQFQNALSATLPGIEGQLMALVLSDSEASRPNDRDRVITLMRVVVMLERVQNSLARARSGGDSAIAAADFLARDVSHISTTLYTLRHGEARTEVGTAEEDSGHHDLDQIMETTAALFAPLQPFLDDLPNRFDAFDAVQEIVIGAEQLAAAAAEARKRLR